MNFAVHKAGMISLAARKKYFLVHKGIGSVGQALVSILPARIDLVRPSDIALPLAVQHYMLSVPGHINSDASLPASPT